MSARQKERSKDDCAVETAVITNAMHYGLLKGVELHCAPSVAEKTDIFARMRTAVGDGAYDTEACQSGLWTKKISSIFPRAVQDFLLSWLVHGPAQQVYSRVVQGAQDRAQTGFIRRWAPPNGFIGAKMAVLPRYLRTD